jgi:hypothetical protein
LPYNCSHYRQWLGRGGGGGAGYRFLFRHKKETPINKKIRTDSTRVVPNK